MAKARRKKMTVKDIVEISGEGYTAEYDENGSTLVITIDTSNDAGLSKPGKMRFCATSKGWKKLGDLGVLFMAGRKVDR